MAVCGGERLSNGLQSGGSAIDCTIRNVSNTGVALDVASPVGILDNFTLFLPCDGLRFPCRVIWRKERRIGVVFE
jgi:PilZ domain-containing protein